MVWDFSMILRAVFFGPPGQKMMHEGGTWLGVHLKTNLRPKYVLVGFQPLLIVRRRPGLIKAHCQSNLSTQIIEFVILAVFLASLNEIYSSMPSTTWLRYNSKKEYFVYTIGLNVL